MRTYTSDRQLCIVGKASEIRQQLQQLCAYAGQITIREYLGHVNFTLDMNASRRKKQRLHHI